MRDVRYMISEASKLVDVEQHTLRYWEDELGLDIQRNEMGHRYYRDIDIELLRAIKAFKDKGYQLRAIKMLIPEIQQKNLSTSNDIEKLQKTCDNRSLNELTEDRTLAKFTGDIGVYNNVNGENSIDKLERFRTIMKNLLMEALSDNNQLLADVVNEEVSNSIIKEMNYLLRIKEEQEELRYKELDRTIREVQSSREEASATRGFFKRKKKGKLF